MPRVGSKIASVSWVVAGGFAAWAAVRVTGADRVRRTETPTVPLLSFTPQVATAAAWAALGLRLTGRRGPAATAGLAALTLGLVVRPRGRAKRQPEATGPVLRLLTANLFYGRADADAIVARVREADVDVLFLQELSADAVTRLKQAGLEDRLPHAKLEVKSGSRGSGIYSRFPLGESPPMPPTRAAQPTALLQLPGGEAVELICAHPAAPALARPGTARWRRELALLPAPGRRPRVLAGDFNATLDHAAFRAVLGRGYVDAAAQTGHGLTPTWGPPGRDALVLTIDHVLVSRGCAVLACAVHAIPGSDHRAVYAEIRLPGL